MERIEEWTRSGQSAAEFAEGKPYTSGTLTWAASRLRNRGADKRRAGRSAARRQPKIQLAEVRRSSKAVAVESLVLEIAGARVAVQRGFDRALLRDVVVALRGDK